MLSRGSTIQAGGSGGGGPGQTQDHQAPFLIVGNALEGDTLFQCDVLDPGDGTGVQAAINAAGTHTQPRTVFVRSGVYLLAAPLGVPRGVSLIGAGMFETVFSNTGGPNRQILDCSVPSIGTGEPSRLSSFAMHVGLAQPGATGSCVANMTGTLSDRIFMMFEQNANSAIANETLQAGFQWLGIPGDESLYFHEKLITSGGISYQRAAVPGMYSAFRTNGGAPGIQQRFHFCSVFPAGDQGDPPNYAVPDCGWYAEGSVVLYGCQALGPWQWCYRLINTTAALLDGCSADYSTNAISSQAFTLEGGQSDYNTLARRTALGFAPQPPGSQAFSFFSAAGNGNKLVECSSLQFPTGVYIDAGFNDTIVALNHVYTGGGNPLLDNGSNTENIGNILT